LFDAAGLVGGLCGACGRRHFPRAAWCPWCGAEGPGEVRLSTRGTLWSWTVVLTAPPGYEGPLPYGLGVVELPDDGLRVVTRLTATEDLAVGQPMAFTVVPLSDDLPTWAFTPEASE
jgi:uncharacterized OB-fold protein